MNAEYISHVGAVREKNEDAVFCDKKAGLFAVADGLGGHLAGEVASATAVRILAETFWRTHEEDAALVLREAFYEANSVLHEAGKAAEMAGMGTTMTAAAVRGDTLHIAHVGDSRAYLLRDGQLLQVTSDHSVVAELVRNGVITQEAARTHPYRNVITRAVGVDPMVEADIFQHDKQKDDLWLICSDGLTNMVPDETIASILKEAENEETAADELLALALEKGGTDNITFVLCRVTEVAAV